MPKGQQPKFSFRIQGDGSNQWTAIKAAWATSKRNVFSVKLKTPGGEELSCVMLVNEPKQRNTSAARGPTAQPRPVA